jgi:hypothetical protein
MILDFVSSGFLYNQNGESKSFYGFLTRTDVMNTAVDHSEQELDPPIGGSFMKSLGNSVSKLGKKAGKTVGNVGKQAGKFALDTGKDIATREAQRGIQHLLSNLA